MPAKAQILNADTFEQKYGALVRREYGDISTAYLLDKALCKQKPPVCMTQGLLKQWFLKYASKRTSASAVATAISISSRNELEEKYGHSLSTMAEQYPTAFKLCAAFKKLTPPVSLPAQVAKEWFKRNCATLKYIGKAGDLEVHCGARIREGGGRSMSADCLRKWLREAVAVDVSEVTCKTWLSKDWSSDGSLRSVYEIEDGIGDLLRAEQYKEAF